MKNIFYKISIIALALFTSCDNEVAFSSDTEALNGFTIIENETTEFVLNSGTPENTIELNWTEATPGVSKEPVYSVQFFNADEATEIISFPSNSEGNSNKITLTFAEIDAMLSAAGFGAGATADLQWQVFATNGDVIISSAKNNISFVRFAANGIKSFELLTPANNELITADIYGKPDEVVTFSWETAETTSGEAIIEYTLLFDDLDGDFSDPLNTFSVEAGETSFDLKYSEIGELFALNKNVIWTVKAKITEGVSMLYAEKKYINWDIAVKTELYLVGDHNGWDNTSALPFTNNGSSNFSIQVDLPENGNFKFLETLGSWDGDWGEDPANLGKLIQEGESNVSVVDAGTYIITVDFPTLSFTVQEFKAPDNLFMVGDHNGWDNASATPFNNDGNGVFSLTQNFSAGNNFKFLPTLGSWEGDWGKDPDNPGSIIQDGEQNIEVPTDGYYVVIVDFNTLTYNLSAINNLYLIGDHNGWDNSTAPQFNTTGNGVFTIVQSFESGNNFKFLPTIGSWDGDWGENPETSGKIVQNDEVNLVAAGTGKYIVTVDFNLLTVNVKELPDTLNLVGSPVEWDNGAALQFTKLSEGVFELSATLSASDEFKFIPTIGSWDNDWGESQIYPGMLVRDEEGNIKSPGDGTYTVTVDFNTGTVTVI